MVCYQSARYQDAYYFVPKKMYPDAKNALSIFSKNSPSFYAFLLPVKDDGKFIELVNKSASGCANKDGKWTDDFQEYKNWADLYSQFAMLAKEKVAHAKRAPVQGAEGTDESWSCGPNSGSKWCFTTAAPICFFVLA